MLGKWAWLGPGNGLVWAGTGLRGLLAGERVKGSLPSPYLAKARVQGRAELRWV